MNGRAGALLAIAIVAIAAAGWLAVRGRAQHAASPAPVAAARSDDAGVAATADGGTPTGPREVGPPKPVAPLRQAPDAPDRVQPYRPAKFLRYSDGVPAKTPAEDDASPILARILAVTHPTLDQESAIRAAWRAHEDSRRELLAKAHPASIGDPVLDPQELGEVDRAFDELLAATLGHEQLARLALEMPPPVAEPEPPTPAP